ncbi:MAG: 50S ribosomal protein L29 [Actinomycetota bacterium]
MTVNLAEIKELSTEEIREKLEETKEELFNLRFQHATGQLDNYRRLRELRKDVARVKTLLRERELEPQETE